ncbi:hypothetical protein F8M41_024864 [Gigaspora margarita]|uniref:Uncharacterized protein n=1 Tax=Gigaspora margarita TaxID=4874 RepID=A0A8H3XLC5_GIGMA|nr:hypothetical protein F8M41_024864 [Gigaspora margarita]
MWKILGDSNPNSQKMSNKYNCSKLAIYDVPMSIVQETTREEELLLRTNIIKGLFIQKATEDIIIGQNPVMTYIRDVQDHMCNYDCSVPVRSLQITCSM